MLSNSPNNLYKSIHIWFKSRQRCFWAIICDLLHFRPFLAQKYLFPVLLHQHYITNNQRCCPAALITCRNQFMYGLNQVRCDFGSLFVICCILGHFWAQKYLFPVLLHQHYNTNNQRCCPTVLITCRNQSMYGLYQVRCFWTIICDLLHFGPFWGPKVPVFWFYWTSITIQINRDAV